MATYPVKQHGGKVCSDMRAAQVLIVDNKAIDTYKLYCSTAPNQRAEKASFIQKCINAGRVIEEPIEQKKAMAGRHPGK
jgi:hypothetical protein